ncbi:MAG: hypothetical protein LBR80_07205 [Deltaproteobacteria bacterium]|jgi:hypothetical protein|nr:hypothetical protein [Deltaproteobacteria bacterium]
MMPFRVPTDDPVPHDIPDSPDIPDTVGVPNSPDIPDTVGVQDCPDIPDTVGVRDCPGITDSSPNVRDDPGTVSRPAASAGALPSRRDASAMPAAARFPRICIAVAEGGRP